MVKIFPLCCIGILMAVLQAPAQPARPKLSPQAQAYAEWLLTGKGAAPADLPAGIRLDARNLPPELEPPHERELEEEFYKNFHPLGIKSTPEELNNALRESESRSEERFVKSPSLSSPPSDWQQQGPFGMEHHCYPGLFFSGRVTCLDFDTASGLYLGTEAGGLWGPPFLYPMSDQLATLGIGAVGVDPADPDRIFLGTGAYAPNALSPVGVGLFITTDHGKNWSLQSTPVTHSGTSKILIAPWNSNIVFVAGDRGIIKSTNGGGSWTLSSPLNTSDLVAAPDGSIMLAGHPWRGVYRSFDQGETWVRLRGEVDWPSSSIGMVRIALAPSNPRRAYVQISNADGWNVLRVYRTDSDTTTPEPPWADITPGPSMSGYLGGFGYMHDAIAVHPTNPDVVWLGGVSALKSTNAGTGWVVNPIPHADVFVLRYRQADSLLYLATDGGIFTSDDDGSTWSSVLNEYLPTTMFSNISVCRTDPRVKYGASLDNSTEGTSIYDSTKWMVSNVADGIDVLVDWSTPSRIFTTTQFSDLFRSTISGTDCTPLTNPQWPWLNVNGGAFRTSWSQHIVQNPVASNWFYTNAGPYIYYSKDTGTTWAPVNLIEPSASTALKVSVNSDGTFLYGIRSTLDDRLTGYQWDGTVGSPHWAVIPISPGTPAVQPWRVVPSSTDPDRAYGIFLNRGDLSQRLYKTTNRGASWTNITGDFTLNVQVLTMVEKPSDPNTLWIGTELGVYKSTNGGTNWWWWERGMPHAAIVTDLEYVQSVSGDYLVAGTNGRSTFERDVDAPIYSHGVTSRSAHGFGGLGDLVVGPCDSSYVAVSTDDGGSWTTKSAPGSGPLYDACIPESLTIVAVGSAGTIVRSTDGGETWGSASSPVAADLRHVAFTSASEGFAVGDQGTIVRSTDGGQSWQIVASGSNQRLHTVLFTDPSSGWISGTDSTGQTPMILLLHTTDGGTNWAPMQSVGPGGGCDVVFPGPATGFLTAEGGLMFKSTDGGQTWGPLQTGTQQSLHDMFFTDENHGWACGDGGTLIRTSDGGSSWTPESTGTNADLFAVLQAGDNLLLGGADGIRSRPLNMPATLSYMFPAGWNLASVPLALEDYTRAALFPDAVSDAFAYQGQYVPLATLANGSGFWIKFSGNQISSMIGFPISRQAIDVLAGWNIVGSIAAPVGVDSIGQEPPGILQSLFYEYDHGYRAAAEIQPARAYWVKAGGNGQITLASGFRVSDDSTILIGGAARAEQRDLLNRCGTLTLEDGTAWKQTLYFSTDDPGRGFVPGRFELPPPPPAGAPDARFASNLMVEQPDPREWKQIPIIVSSARYPVTISWKIHDPSGDALLQLGDERIPLTEDGRTTVEGPGSNIALRLGPASPRQAVPEKFMLSQNYPNPFNPATSIHYGLPEESYVQLRIYDVLGRVVATLVDGVQEPGDRSVEWDGAAFPSGVYYYRIRAGSFSDMRKMLLIR